MTIMRRHLDSLTIVSTVTQIDLNNALSQQHILGDNNNNNFISNF